MAELIIVLMTIAGVETKHFEFPTMEECQKQMKLARVVGNAQIIQKLCVESKPMGDVKWGK